MNKSNDPSPLMGENSADGASEAHPLRTHYIGSVLTSGPDEHRLTIRYRTREAADAAQAWLAAGVTASVAHSKSEYKRRVAMGDPNVQPPAGVLGTFNEQEKKHG